MDNVCIICREEMVTGAKRLPCNHIFHTRWGRGRGVAARPVSSACRWTWERQRSRAGRALDLGRGEAGPLVPTQRPRACPGRWGRPPSQGCCCAGVARHCSLPDGGPPSAPAAACGPGSSASRPAPPAGWMSSAPPSPPSPRQPPSSRRPGSSSSTSPPSSPSPPTVSLSSQPGWGGRVDVSSPHAAAGGTRQRAWVRAGLGWFLGSCLLWVGIGRVPQKSPAACLLFPAPSPPPAFCSSQTRLPFQPGSPPLLLLASLHWLLFCSWIKLTRLSPPAPSSPATLLPHLLQPTGDFLSHAWTSVRSKSSSSSSSRCPSLGGGRTDGHPRPSLNGRCRRWLLPRVVPYQHSRFSPAVPHPGFLKTWLQFFFPFGGPGGWLCQGPGVGVGEASSVVLPSGISSFLPAVPQGILPPFPPGMFPLWPPMGPFPPVPGAQPPSNADNASATPSTSGAQAGEGGRPSPGLDGFPLSTALESVWVERKSACVCV